MFLDLDNINMDQARVCIPDDESRYYKNLNPPGVGLFPLIWEDLVTHRRDPLSQGFIALLVHRFGNVAKSARPLLLRRIGVFLYRLVNRIAEYLTGITILHSTIMGRRVHIWHHSGIILNADYVGNDVVIRQGTTLGEKFSGKGRPKIEDGVNIGCNVVVVGNVVIGSKATIGACCFVGEDVPSGAVVVSGRDTSRLASSFDE